MHLNLSDLERESARIRRPIYQDVESLLSPGFLSHQVVVGGVSLSLRSLTQQDIFLLTHRIGLQARERAWKEWALAMSTWVIDGHLVLGNQEVVHSIWETLNHLPAFTINTLFSILSGLFNRVGRAVSLVEAFCYEDHSRSMWRFSGKGTPTHTSASGVPGTETLGLNAVQQVWWAFNMAEDDRDTWEEEWERAKFIASASAPKAIKKMAGKEQTRAASERDRRLRIIHDAYWKATGGQGDLLGGGIRVQQAVSREDLVDEMAKVRRGEKDWHDMVVEDYKDRIRRKHQEAQQFHQQRMIEVQEAILEDDPSPQPDVLVGYTREQLAGFQRGPHRPVVQDGTSVNSLYHRYIEPEVKAGAVHSDGRAVAVPRDNLGDALAGRNPQFHKGTSQEGSG